MSSCSVSCAVCDLLCAEADCDWFKAEGVPNRDLLVAASNLIECDMMRPLFFNYPGDARKILNRLALAREGFELEAPYRLRVCSTCLSDLRKNKLPKAANANGFVFGDFPKELQGVSWVEMMAASPVRLSGTVLALEQFKVGRIPGSARTMIRGTFTFYQRNSYAIGKQLPACDTDITGSFACTFVGPRPTNDQLGAICWGTKIHGEGRNGLDTRRRRHIDWSARARSQCPNFRGKSEVILRRRVDTKGYSRRSYSHLR